MTNLFYDERVRAARAALDVLHLAVTSPAADDDPNLFVAAYAMLLTVLPENQQRVPTMLLAWCEAYIDHSTDGDRNCQLGCRVQWMDRETGQSGVGPHPGVPDRVVWAGELIAARVHDDQDRFVALLRDLGKLDGEEAGHHIVTVLEVITMAIRTTARGYVQKGRLPAWTSLN